jgi:hypothetical protein
MSRRTHLHNAFTAQLANAITAGSTTIELTTVVGLLAPGYLVIDHDIDAKREWIRFTGIASNTLTGVTRGLAMGSSGAGGPIAHAQGAVVRATAMAQHFDDLFSDVEDLEAADATHAAAPNPHPGYATDADLAATNAVVGTHTTDIAALEAVDVVHDTDIAALEAADLAHFGGTDVEDHPEATPLVRGFMSALDKEKLDAQGFGCRVSTSVLQTLATETPVYVSFDVEHIDNAEIHTAASSLFVIPRTGFWVARFRNAAQVALRRTVMLREGSTPGTGNAYVMANGTFLDSVTSEPGRNIWVLGR